MRVDGIIRHLITQEGRDAAAEERIVLSLAKRYPPPPGGYVSTDVWRNRIRKLQGRKRVRQLGQFTEEE